MINMKDLQSEKYISVGTYRKNGDIVNTPVWFFIKDQRIYIVTRSKTGKVKRLQNNNKVTIAKCTMSGEITGPRATGIANIIHDSTQSSELVKLRNKKYGMKARFANFMTKGKGEHVVFSVKIDEN